MDDQTMQRVESLILKEETEHAVDSTAAAQPSVSVAQGEDT